MEPVEAGGIFSDALSMLLAPFRAWFDRSRWYVRRPPFSVDATLVCYAVQLQPPGAPLTPELMLACALYDPRVAARLARGLDVETARAQLLAAGAAAAEGTPPDAVSPHLHAALVHAAGDALARGGEEVTVGDLVRALRIGSRACAACLGDDGQDFAALDGDRQVSVVGRVPAGPATRRIDVFAVNDDITSVERVLAILGEVWGLAPAHASYVTMETDKKGHGFIGRFDGDDARAREARAVAMARAVGAPLRFALFVAD